jgi:PAS domain S-box-containing protein
MLPGTLSFDICAQIQALPNDPATPVLMITDNDDGESVDRALMAGAADYVTKPIHPGILRQRIRRLLQAHQTSVSVIRAKKEWEAAFDAVSDIIILTDLDGKIIRCNLATIQRLESSYIQLIGFNLEDILWKGNKQKFNLTFGQPLEIQLPTLPGWFEMRMFPGQVGRRHRAIVYILKDITERKQLEENLQKSEQRFKALVENISEGIELFDAEARVLYASPMVARILGFPTTADLVGVNPMADIHPDDLERNLTLFAQLLRQPGGSFTTELRTKHANRSWIWVEASARNLLNEPGINAILVNFKDISERKRVDSIPTCQ